VEPAEHDWHLGQARPAGSIPGLVVCGTGSGVGKSVVVAGLCRSLARTGVRVAPFKAQNMSNNSSVAVDDGEIGRAQFAQARAAGIDPTTAMNPVLLKPTADRTCDVIVRGHLAGRSSAADYGAWTSKLRGEVLAAFDELAAAYDVVVCEGAGGAAEINLLHRDLVNLPFARAAGLPAIVVADIERGGAFSGLFGVWAILPPALRATIAGFVINRFRGDPALLTPGIEELEARTGVPVLGVVPWFDGVRLDEEDSQFLVESHPEHAAVDVAAIRFPRVANTSDLDPLAAEPHVRVRWVQDVGELGRPDLIVLPGSKSTVEDLEWLRAAGLASAVRDSDAVVMGICAGFQMLGDRIVDPIESQRGEVDGLGLLPLTTTFVADKTVRRRNGSIDGDPVAGYEIRHGQPAVTSARPWLQLDDRHGVDDEGAVDGHGRVFGTSLHGLFESDAFRRSFLTRLDTARRGGAGAGAGAEVVYGDVLRARADAIADLLDAHLDMARLLAIARVGLPGDP
jgi:adenosylcobyric acid synthase